MAQLNGSVDKVVTLLGEFGGTQISGEVNKVVTLSGQFDKVTALLATFGVGFKEFITIVDCNGDTVVDYNGATVYTPQINN